MSKRRVAAIEKMWKGKVEAVSEVEAHSYEMARLRQHEYEVAKRAQARRDAACRTARHVLSSTNGWTEEGMVLQREAMRETMLECMRREEIVKRKEIAEREAWLATVRATETDAVRQEGAMKVSAKRLQEEEMMEHLRQVEKEKVMREEAAGAAREENKQQKEKEKKELLDVRKQRDEMMAAIAVERRKAWEIKQKEKKEEKERAAEIREEFTKEKARLKQEAKVIARREAAFEYARRLEKVWKHTEAFAARCEAEHDRALHEAEARTSSYTEIRLDQLEMKSKMSRARAESAKQAYDTCLMQYRALEKGGAAVIKAEETDKKE